MAAFGLPSRRTLSSQSSHMHASMRQHINPMGILDIAHLKAVSGPKAKVEF